MLVKRWWTGGQSTAWWVEKQKKATEKKPGKNKSANTTEKDTKSDNESDNYVMLGYTLPKNTLALVCTSDFKHKDHTTSKSNSTILDCGMSSHFTPECIKLLNYREISPEPIQAANGHTFSVTGKADLKLELPNGDQKPTPVTLKMCTTHHIWLLHQCLWE